MVPRKKKKIILITFITIIIMGLLSTFYILYSVTDLFKSNEHLFLKYMEQNINNVESIAKIFEKNEYNKLLSENKYTSDTQIKVNYIEDIGTSLENTKNDINKFKIRIYGQTDKQNQEDYKNIQLLKDNEKEIEFEYIQNFNTYGIKFTDLFKQYILVDNENLKELFAKIGYEEKDLENIPNQIQFDENLKNVLDFTEDEEKSIKEKYIGVFNNEALKGKVSKQENVQIKVGDNDINTNAYTLTLTVEELNSIYINILEMLKQDEIILSKLDSLQKGIAISNMNITNIKESFISNIDEIINKINKNNIGNEETKIIVYEKDGNTIRTSIQAIEYEVNFDYLNDLQYIQINIKDKEQQKYSVIELDNNDNEISFTVEKVNADKIKKISIVKSEEVDGTKCEKNIIAKLEDGSNKIEANIKENFEIVDEFEQKVELNDEDFVKLNDLDEQNLTRIIDLVIEKVSNKMNIISEDVNKEDLQKFFETLGIIKMQEIKENGISDIEKNRFNSRFEMLKGENLESNYILNVIEECKDNLIRMEVVSSNELKLELDPNKKNEQIEKQLTTFIEKNNNLNYNVDVEYDEENGIVNDIILTIVKK